MAAMAHRFLDNLALFDYIYHFIAIEKGDFPCLKFPEGPKKGVFSDDRLAMSPPPIASCRGILSD
jgi:hypothetical protein